MKQPITQQPIMQQAIMQQAVPQSAPSKGATIEAAVTALHPSKILSPAMITLLGTALDPIAAEVARQQAALAALRGAYEALARTPTCEGLAAVSAALYEMLNPATPALPLAILCQNAATATTGCRQAIESQIQQEHVRTQREDAAARKALVSDREEAAEAGRIHNLLQKHPGQKAIVR